MPSWRVLPRTPHTPACAAHAHARRAQVEREKQRRVAAALALLNRPHARLAKGAEAAAGGEAEPLQEDAA